MPGLATATSTTATSAASTTSAESTDAASESYISETSDGSMPAVSTSSTGMPGITTTSTTSTDGYTTPSVGVPLNASNPYIFRTSKPLGTVFIAVGSVVALILFLFLMFHLIKSFTASSTARKTVDNEKFAYHEFAQNNNVAYGGSIMPQTSTFLNTEYQGSMNRLPLLSPSRSPQMFGGMDPNDSGTLNYTDNAASQHDLTKMFISPTKEMTGSRIKSQQFNASVTNFSLHGASMSDVGLLPALPKNQAVPSVYLEEDYSQSESSVPPRTPRNKRKTIPSMYLEDLIDE